MTTPHADARSVAEMFLHRVAQTPEREAYRYPTTGADGTDTWKSLSWREVSDRVRAIASGLRALGLADEDRCAILCSTRIEWILVDLAILCAGGATTTIYPSSTAEESAFIVADSETRFVFAEDAAQLAKLASKRAELPNLKQVIVIDNKGFSDGDFALSLDALMAKGREYDAAHPQAFEQVARAVRPEALATLIYTSGTTGQPKGVELTHDCWIYEGQAIAELGLLETDDLQYLWLPLSHVFGKVLESAQLHIGFATAVDGRIDKLVANLAVVRPTFVAAVPRIFEKVHNKVVGGAREGGAVKRAIFKWAVGVGRQASALRQQGEEPRGWLGVQVGLADKLVFSKLRAIFGGRVRFFISGSAPLNRDLAEFFHAAGVLVCEGYGLTESSAASFVNRPHAFRFGTVGQALPGTEVRIAAEDGEILLRGRGIMRGYRGQPEATAAALDADGWLHTGDIGEVDADGFLRITDRKKDLIKTSGGKYVAPQALEGALKVACPYVSQVLVHGDKRNYVSALVTLDEEAVRKWAAGEGLGEASVAELSRNEKLRALLQGYFDQLNATLPRYATIKKFAVLPADFTVEAGELTPSLKPKRKAIEAKYRAVLDAFYDDALAAM